MLYKPKPMLHLLTVLCLALGAIACDKSHDLPDALAASANVEDAAPASLPAVASADAAILFPAPAEMLDLSVVDLTPRIVVMHAVPASPPRLSDFTESDKGRVQPWRSGEPGEVCDTNVSDKRGRSSTPRLWHC